MGDLPDFSAHGYEAIRQLGLNAAGGRVVYLAVDRNTQKQVAIKQFQFAKGAGWSEFKAIEQEIEVLQGLNHRGIPHHLGSFETEDGYCIVQEYKDARPLSTPRSFDADEVKQIAVAVLEILVYLQKQAPPIIHRDIKPENIVIDEQLNVYLIDFGLARTAGATTASSMAAGTFGFMAPEQIYNKDLTAAADLYSLGATLIALLTGTKSTEMDTLIDEDGRIAFQDRVPKLSLRFIDWLEKMVAPKLKHRYPDAATALKELQPLYVNRFPSVELSQPSLEFKATQIRSQELTQTITIINSTPETVLEGKWSVAPHPNDPPHSPDSHAWISFSPKEFKGNKVECQVTVDTSQLIDQASGERALILQTNSIPGTHTLALNITTAPLPFAVKKLHYLMTANLLVSAVVEGFLAAKHGRSMLATGSDVLASVGLTAFLTVIYTLWATPWIWMGGRLNDLKVPISSNLLLWAAIIIALFEFRGGIEVWVRPMFWVIAFFMIWGEILRNLRADMWHHHILVSLLAFLVFPVAGLVWPFMFWLMFVVQITNPGASSDQIFAFKLDPVVLFWFISLIENVKVYFSKIAELNAVATQNLDSTQMKNLDSTQMKRYRFSFLIFLILVTGAFGICLGISLKIGFMSNPYLLPSTLGTGALSVFLFLFAPLQRYRQIFAYRQREKNLIKP